MRVKYELLRFPSNPKIDANGYIIGEWLGKSYKVNDEQILLSKIEDLVLASPYQEGDFYEGKLVLFVKVIMARTLYLNRLKWKSYQKRNGRTRFFRFIRDCFEIGRNDFRQNTYFWVLFLQSNRPAERKAGSSEP